MHTPHVDRTLSRITAQDKVLDVGGWACPFNRANWILDMQPYETRGFYATFGMCKSQGGDQEFFSKETWIRRDICAREPWPFPDKFFEYSICSHTLEDVRDPLFVCEELIRVSKAGYIEVPSRLAESSRGWESERQAGLSHHRWLIDIVNNQIQFTMKYHMIHRDFELSFPSSFLRRLPSEKKVAWLFWENSFTHSETVLHTSDSIYSYLREFVQRHYCYPKYRFWLQKARRLISRGLSATRSRVGL